jgi:RNA polymerase sigma-70 factor (ECF subfamily)
MALLQSSESAATIAPAAAPSRNSPASGIERDILELFDALRARLIRYLTGFMLAVPDAEEIVQETFLALFQHLRQGGPRDNLKGWLFRVAHNLALKKRYRERREYQNLSVSLPAEDLVLDPGLNPEDQLASRQTRAKLMAVVQALPEQDRQCLILRAEGLRYREIAGVLDMSLGSISISLGRSLARLSRAAGR